MSHETLYHGTTESKADNLQQNGIIKRLLQSRDRGFFGEGLYVTTDKEIAERHATTVAEKDNGTPEIIKIQLPEFSVFHPGSLFPDNGSIKPQNRPKWHTEFIDEYISKLEEGAVWNKVQSVTKEEIISRGKEEMDPESNQFEREQWYQEVTDFGFATDHTIVWWTRSEIIINPDAQITVLRG